MVKTHKKSKKISTVVGRMEKKSGREILEKVSMI
jgi:hypothetical protein